MCKWKVKVSAAAAAVTAGSDFTWPSNTLQTISDINDPVTILTAANFYHKLQSKDLIPGLSRIRQENVEKPI